MIDNWQDDPAMKRAAFIGMIGNGSIPTADRIAMAQQVIRELETELAKATDALAESRRLFTIADADTAAQAVFQAVGEASMCWENPGGAGVFREAQASDIARALLTQLGYQTPAWALGAKPARPQ